MKCTFMLINLLGNNLACTHVSLPPNVLHVCLRLELRNSKPAIVSRDWFIGQQVDTTGLD